MAFDPNDGETLKGIRRALEHQNTLLHRQNILLSIVAREMICVNHEMSRPRSARPRRNRLRSGWP